MLLRSLSSKIAGVRPYEALQTRWLNLQPGGASAQAKSTARTLQVKRIRNALVWSRATGGGRRQNRDSEGSNQGSSSSRMSITDILTLLSQVVLLGTSALGAAMAFYPEIISSRISSYKDRLIERRHQRIVAHLASDRPHVFEEVGSSDGVEHLPHEEVARGLREGVLDATPVRRYSIVVGPPGSGKSSVVRAAVQGKAGVGGGKRCDYVARLSLRLVATASSLVDALSEEVGCDLEDWTERLLSSYLFAGSPTGVVTPLDKLAFLLDEMEEAFWLLKYTNPADGSNTQPRRPVIVIDDLDAIDLTDPTLSKAVRLLFNAAAKWAREDSAVVVFTATDDVFDKEISNIVAADALASSSLVTIHDLPRPSALALLSRTSQATPSQDLDHVLNTIGTRLGEIAPFSASGSDPAVLRELVDEHVREEAGRMRRAVGSDWSGWDVKVVEGRVVGKGKKGEEIVAKLVRGGWVEDGTLEFRRLMGQRAFESLIARRK